MKKKLREMSLMDLAIVCHKQDSCYNCPLCFQSMHDCLVQSKTPQMLLVSYGENEIDVDYSVIDSTPERQTITQEEREIFFEDR